ncbi:MAG: threonylcarbamoyl-AMP synthase [Bryobacteraceae bacterium]|nr:threonylcarbamoyl-AMP synthase [Bryobacteraceae bacterium]
MPSWSGARRAEPLETAKTPGPTDPPGPSSDVAYAAERIRQGKLVVFPTETVYGLGANALDPDAVARIYQVKGRPATSPLIVHVASVDQARTVAREWPEQAARLAERYWPGPLTLVLPKQPVIPDIVTAGLPTVGVRIPAHPLALALIRAAGVPIAGPSANPFTRVSPTEADHVPDAIAGEVDYILDGGPAPVGIESTVLSLAGAAPALLRPGMISRSDIERVIGPVTMAGRMENAHPSPGMHSKHYAPATRLRLVTSGRLPAAGRGAYLWREAPAAAEVSIRMPASAPEYAAALYKTLHELDHLGLDWIAVEALPDDPEWTAVRDRLSRASS